MKKVRCLRRPTSPRRRAVRLLPALSRTFGGLMCWKETSEIGGVFAPCLLGAQRQAMKPACGLLAFPPGVRCNAYVARGFGPFVDLLLTRRLDSKKPPAREALKLLI